MKFTDEKGGQWESGQSLAAYCDNLDSLSAVTIYRVPKPEKSNAEIAEEWANRINVNDFRAFWVQMLDAVDAKLAKLEERLRK